MNAAHFHLILNHVPVIGAVGLAVLLAIAWVRRDTPLTKVSLALGAAVGGHEARPAAGLPPTDLRGAGFAGSPAIPSLPHGSLRGEVTVSPGPRRNLQ